MVRQNVTVRCLGGMREVWSRSREGGVKAKRDDALFIREEESRSGLPKCIIIIMKNQHMEFYSSFYQSS